jgi:hypothetical protein
MIQSTSIHFCDKSAVLAQKKPIFAVTSMFTATGVARREGAGGCLARPQTESGSKIGYKNNLK